MMAILIFASEDAKELISIRGLLLIHIVTIECSFIVYILRPSLRTFRLQFSFGVVSLVCCIRRYRPYVRSLHGYFGFPCRISSLCYIYVSSCSTKNSVYPTVEIQGCPPAYFSLIQPNPPFHHGQYNIAGTEIKGVTYREKAEPWSTHATERDDR